MRSFQNLLRKTAVSILMTSLATSCKFFNSKNDKEEPKSAQGSSGQPKGGGATGESVSANKGGSETATSCDPKFLEARDLVIKEMEGLKKELETSKKGAELQFGSPPLYSSALKYIQISATGNTYGASELVYDIGKGTSYFKYDSDAADACFKGLTADKTTITAESRDAILSQLTKSKVLDNKDLLVCKTSVYTQSLRFYYEDKTYNEYEIYSPEDQGGGCINNSQPAAPDNSKRYLSDDISEIFELLYN
ncbi:MAG: hypothetical protein HQK54_18310 [Oligoflexales bacterium]|nr:hypothetical protein [Oligoflexales bacterium]